MSKMKELDHIADCVVDVIYEHLDHNISWAIDDTIVEKLEGDEFNEAVQHIKTLVINKLYWGDGSPVINSLQNKHES